MLPRTIDWVDGRVEVVLVHQGRRVTPLGSTAWNPAFDVTPADLVTSVVTEAGIWRP